MRQDCRFSTEASVPNLTPPAGSKSVEDLREVKQVGYIDYYLLGKEQI